MHQMRYSGSSNFSYDKNDLYTYLLSILWRQFIPNGEQCFQIPPISIENDSYPRNMKLTFLFYFYFKMGSGKSEITTFYLQSHLLNMNSHFYWQRIFYWIFAVCTRFVQYLFSKPKICLAVFRSYDYHFRWIQP